MKKQPQYHHFTNDELWNLDCTIAKFVLPRLKRFKKHTIAHPATLTEKQWDNILDKMIFSFEHIASDNLWALESVGNKKIEKKVQEGLQLFATWFTALWW